MSTLNICCPPQETRSTVKLIFDFLSDFSNFAQVLPAGRVADFRLTEKGCAFTVQGLAELNVVLENALPYERISYLITGPVRSELHLEVVFTGEPAQAGTAEVLMKATLNPFLKTMAEKPLHTLASTIADRISTLEL